MELDARSLGFDLRCSLLLALVACEDLLGTDKQPDTADSGTEEGDADTDADADADADSDSDSDSDTTHPIGVYGLGSVYIAPGTDYFDFTADGIPPYSFSRHSLEVRNESSSVVTLTGIEMTAREGTFDSELSIIDPSSSAPVPFDLAGVELAPGESAPFDLYFVPLESGPKTDDLSLRYEGGSYDFSVSGRGRDALSIFDPGANTLERVHGAPDGDTLAGAAVLDDEGNLYFGGNVNEWSDGFSENIALSRMNADGLLAWSYEWDEPYEQLQPDSGQNAETGGGAESIARDEDHIYVVGRRSLSSSNSTFQSLVFAVDPQSGEMIWASAMSPEDTSAPSIAWQSCEAYAIDASLSDRVIVAGTSLGNAEVLLFALDKADGSLLWSYQLDVASGYNDRAHTLAIASDGSAWVGGITNSRGLLARIDGVDGPAPSRGGVWQLDMGIGSHVNSMDIDAAGDVYLSLDRRGATTQLSAAKISAQGSLLWAKTWDEGNFGDNNNSHVIRADDLGHVYLGGRVAIETADTQFGDAFLLRLQSDGAYDWGGFYYTGKGAEEVIEHRVKGIATDSAGDLRLLLQGYTANQNYEHYWGNWYNLDDDPLADLTLGEDPGNGAALLVDYVLPFEDITSSTDFHETDGAYNGTNSATVFSIDTSSLWHAPPAEVTWEDSALREGNAPDGHNLLMMLDLD